MGPSTHAAESAWSQIHMQPSWSRVGSACGRAGMRLNLLAAEPAWGRISMQTSRHGAESAWGLFRMRPSWSAAWWAPSWPVHLCADRHDKKRRPVTDSALRPSFYHGPPKQAFVDCLVLDGNCLEASAVWRLRQRWASRAV
eukprot:364347-Chlamydomonas_euryale.AAC.15